MSANDTSSAKIPEGRRRMTVDEASEFLESQPLLKKLVSEFPHLADEILPTVPIDTDVAMSNDATNDSPTSTMPVTKRLSGKNTNKDKKTPDLDRLVFTAPHRCRICQKASYTRKNRMLQPCECKGSVGFAHEACTLQWMQKSRSLMCTVCNTTISASKLYEEGAERPEDASIYLKHWRALLYVTKVIRKFVSIFLFAGSMWLVLFPLLTIALSYGLFGAAVPLSVANILRFIFFALGLFQPSSSSPHDDLYSTSPPSSSSAGTSSSSSSSSSSSNYHHVFFTAPPLTSVGEAVVVWIFHIICCLVTLLFHFGFMTWITWCNENAATLAEHLQPPAEIQIDARGFVIVEAPAAAEPAAAGVGAAGAPNVAAGVANNNNVNGDAAANNNPIVAGGADDRVRAAGNGNVQQQQHIVAPDAAAAEAFFITPAAGGGSGKSSDNSEDDEATEIEEEEEPVAAPTAAAAAFSVAPPSAAIGAASAAPEAVKTPLTSTPEANSEPVSASPNVETENAMTTLAPPQQEKVVSSSALSSASTKTPLSAPVAAAVSAPATAQPSSPLSAPAAAAATANTEHAETSAATSAPATAAAASTAKPSLPQSSSSPAAPLPTPTSAAVATHSTEKPQLPSTAAATTSSKKTAAASSAPASPPSSPSSSKTTKKAAASSTTTTTKPPPQQQQPTTQTAPTTTIKVGGTIPDTLLFEEDYAMRRDLRVERADARFIFDGALRLVNNNNNGGDGGRRGGVAAAANNNNNNGAGPAAAGVNEDDAAFAARLQREEDMAALGLGRANNNNNARGGGGGLFGLGNNNNNDGNNNDNNNDAAQAAADDEMARQAAEFNLVDAFGLGGGHYLDAIAFFIVAVFATTTMWIFLAFPFNLYVFVSEDIVPLSLWLCGFVFTYSGARLLTRLSTVVFSLFGGSGSTLSITDASTGVPQEVDAIDFTFDCFRHLFRTHISNPLTAAALSTAQKLTPLWLKVTLHVSFGLPLLDEGLYMPPFQPTTKSAVAAMTELRMWGETTKKPRQSRSEHILPSSPLFTLTLKNKDTASLSLLEISNKEQSHSSSSSTTPFVFIQTPSATELIMASSSSSAAAANAMLRGNNNGGRNNNNNNGDGLPPLDKVRVVRDFILLEEPTPTTAATTEQGKQQKKSNGNSINSRDAIKLYATFRPLSAALTSRHVYSSPALSSTSSSVTSSLSSTTIIPHRYELQWASRNYSDYASFFAAAHDHLVAATIETYRSAVEAEAAEAAMRLGGGGGEKAADADGKGGAVVDAAVAAAAVRAGLIMRGTGVVGHVESVILEDASQMPSAAAAVSAEAVIRKTKSHPSSFYSSSASSLQTTFYVADIHTSTSSSSRLRSGTVFGVYAPVFINRTTVKVTNFSDFAVDTQNVVSSEIRPIGFLRNHYILKSTSKVAAAGSSGSISTSSYAINNNENGNLIAYRPSLLFPAVNKVCIWIVMAAVASKILLFLARGQVVKRGQGTTAGGGLGGAEAVAAGQNGNAANNIHDDNAGNGGGAAAAPQQPPRQKRLQPTGLLRRLLIRQRHQLVKVVSFANGIIARALHLGVVTIVCGLFTVVMLSEFARQPTVDLHRSEYEELLKHLYGEDVIVKKASSSSDSVFDASPSSSSSSLSDVEVEERLLLNLGTASPYGGGSGGGGSIAGAGAAGRVGSPTSFLFGGVMNLFSIFNHALFGTTSSFSSFLNGDDDEESVKSSSSSSSSSSSRMIRNLVYSFIPIHVSMNTADDAFAFLGAADIGLCSAGITSAAVLDEANRQEQTRQRNQKDHHSSYRYVSSWEEYRTAEYQKVFGSSEEKGEGNSSASNFSSFATQGKKKNKQTNKNKKKKKRVGRFSQTLSKLRAAEETSTRRVQQQQALQQNADQHNIKLLSFLNSRRRLHHGLALVKRETSPTSAYSSDDVVSTIHQLSRRRSSLILTLSALNILFNSPPIETVAAALASASAAASASRTTNETATADDSSGVCPNYFDVSRCDGSVLDILGRQQLDNKAADNNDDANERHSFVLEQFLPQGKKMRTTLAFDPHATSFEQQQQQEKLYFEAKAKQLLKAYVHAIFWTRVATFDELPTLLFFGFVGLGITKLFVGGITLLRTTWHYDSLSWLFPVPMWASQAEYIIRLPTRVQIFPMLKTVSLVAFALFSVTKPALWIVRRLFPFVFPFAMSDDSLLYLSVVIQYFDRAIPEQAFAKCADFHRKMNNFFVDVFEVGSLIHDGQWHEANGFAAPPPEAVAAAAAAAEGGGGGGADNAPAVGAAPPPAAEGGAQQDQQQAALPPQQPQPSVAHSVSFLFRLACFVLCYWGSWVFSVAGVFCVFVLTSIPLVSMQAFGGQELFSSSSSHTSSSSGSSSSTSTTADPFAEFPPSMTHEIMRRSRSSSATIMNASSPLFDNANEEATALLQRFYGFNEDFKRYSINHGGALTSYSAFLSHPIRVVSEYHANSSSSGGSDITQRGGANMKGISAALRKALSTPEKLYQLLHPDEKKKKKNEDGNDDENLSVYTIDDMITELRQLLFTFIPPATDVSSFYLGTSSAQRARQRQQQPIVLFSSPSEIARMTDDTYSPLHSRSSPSRSSPSSSSSDSREEVNKLIRQLFPATAATASASSFDLNDYGSPYYNGLWLGSDEEQALLEEKDYDAFFEGKIKPLAGNLTSIVENDGASPLLRFVAERVRSFQRNIAPTPRHLIAALLNEERAVFAELERDFNTALNTLGSVLGWVSQEFNPSSASASSAHTAGANSSHNAHTNGEGHAADDNHVDSNDSNNVSAMTKSDLVRRLSINESLLSVYFGLPANYGHRSSSSRSPSPTSVVDVKRLLHSLLKISPPHQQRGNEDEDDQVGAFVPIPFSAEKFPEWAPADLFRYGNGHRLPPLDCIPRSKLVIDASASSSHYIFLSNVIFRLAVEMVVKDAMDAFAQNSQATNDASSSITLIRRGGVVAIGDEKGEAALLGDRDEEKEAAPHPPLRFPLPTRPRRAQQSADDSSHHHQHHDHAHAHHDDPYYFPSATNFFPVEHFLTWFPIFSFTILWVQLQPIFLGLGWFVGGGGVNVNNNMFGAFWGAFRFILVAIGIMNGRLDGVEGNNDNNNDGVERNNANVRAAVAAPPLRANNDVNADARGNDNVRGQPAVGRAVNIGGQAQQEQQQQMAPPAQGNAQKREEETTAVEQQHNHDEDKRGTEKSSQKAVVASEERTQEEKKTMSEDVETVSATKPTPATTPAQPLQETIAAAAETNTVEQQPNKETPPAPEDIKKISSPSPSADAKESAIVADDAATVDFVSTPMPASTSGSLPIVTTTEEAPRGAAAAAASSLTMPNDASTVSSTKDETDKKKEETRETTTPSSNENAEEKKNEETAETATTAIAHIISAPSTARDAAAPTAAVADDEMKFTNEVKGTKKENKTVASDSSSSSSSDTSSSDEEEEVEEKKGKKDDIYDASDDFHARITSNFVRRFIYRFFPPQIPFLLQIRLLLTLGIWLTIRYIPVQREIQLPPQKKKQKKTNRRKSAEKLTTTESAASNDDDDSSTKKRTKMQTFLVPIVRVNLIGAFRGPHNYDDNAPLTSNTNDNNKGQGGGGIDEAHIGNNAVEDLENEMEDEDARNFMWFWQWFDDEAPEARIRRHERERRQRAEGEPMRGYLNVEGRGVGRAAPLVIGRMLLGSFAFMFPSYLRRRRALAMLWQHQAIMEAKRAEEARDVSDVLKSLQKLQDSLKHKLEEQKKKDQQQHNAEVESKDIAVVAHNKNDDDKNTKAAATQKNSDSSPTEAASSGATASSVTTAAPPTTTSGITSALKENNCDDGKKEKEEKKMKEGAAVGGAVDEVKGEERSDVCEAANNEKQPSKPLKAKDEKKKQKEEVGDFEEKDGKAKAKHTTKMAQDLLQNLKEAKSREDSLLRTAKNNNNKKYENHGRVQELLTLLAALGLAEAIGGDYEKEALMKQMAAELSNSVLKGAAAANVDPSARSVPAIDDADPANPKIVVEPGNRYHEVIVGPSPSVELRFNAVDLHYRIQNMIIPLRDLPHLDRIVTELGYGASVQSIGQTFMRTATLSMFFLSAAFPAVLAGVIQCTSVALGFFRSGVSVVDGRIVFSPHPPSSSSGEVTTANASPTDISVSFASILQVVPFVANSSAFEFVILVVCVGFTLHLLLKVFLKNFLFVFYDGGDDDTVVSDKAVTSEEQLQKEEATKTATSGTTQQQQQQTKKTSSAAARRPRMKGFTTKTGLKTPYPLGLCVFSIMPKPATAAAAAQQQQKDTKEAKQQRAATSTASPSLLLLPTPPPSFALVSVVEQMIIDKGKLATLSQAAEGERRDAIARANGSAAAVAAANEVCEKQKAEIKAKLDRFVVYRNFVIDDIEENGKAQAGVLRLLSNCVLDIARGWCAPMIAASALIAVLRFCVIAHSEIFAAVDDGSSSLAPSSSPLSDIDCLAYAWLSAVAFTFSLIRLAYGKLDRMPMFAIVETLARRYYDEKYCRGIRLHNHPSHLKERRERGHVIKRIRAAHGSSSKTTVLLGTSKKRK